MNQNPCSIIIEVLIILLVLQPCFMETCTQEAILEEMKGVLGEEAAQYAFTEHVDGQDCLVTCNLITKFPHIDEEHLHQSADIDTKCNVTIDWDEAKRGFDIAKASGDCQKDCASAQILDEGGP
eukprot:TRINITY_DN1123_c0_g1_i2.p2 TRINITY_DN1123_c0_g1~~TRINITY_DN1123_c0_g1_i2.p2  ORF type:complete len:124 (+),score=21.70 TRINITY_DN1123_c0_g1_i2:90-461(+)